MSKAQHVTDADFKHEVLDSSTPVLVDFWAEWCAPCKQIGAFIDDLAKEKSGALKVTKLDIDGNPDVPVRYGVNGIPTLIVFKAGREAARRVGAMPRSELFNWVEQTLEKT